MALRRMGQVPIYRDSMEVLERARLMAQFQGALSWELRAATSLAKLHAENGRIDLATAMLEPTYNGFREGHGTMDLCSAKAQLEGLSRKDNWL